MPVEQVVQVTASLLILIPFVLVQLGRLTVSATSYLVLNLVGSATLAVDAALGRDWGFLLLEAVWAVVSLVGLVSALTRRPERPEQPA